IKEGAKYFYMPDGEKDIPDPGSHFQPEGVHGPSQVITQDFPWDDQDWKGMPLSDLILYEMHVGTFTEEGTFEAIIPRLDDLIEDGINAIELMPVTQFPGSRNWGYDTVYPYAVQNSYGGPEGLKKLVSACHKKGISVILDLVYNHLGPEGNYFDLFGPYFTDQYKTPWGRAINFDGPWSDGVREYFSNNPLYWFQYFHIDGLRLDAIHSIYDNGALHFWELTHNKIKELEKTLGRSFIMIAESDYNSPKVVKDPSVGGFGFTAQWLDDFHHALYTIIDPAGKDRYIDFGKTEQLAKAYKEGFVHSGEFVKFRKRRHGVSSAGISGDKFIAFNLNHDQVGNRVGGERLCMLVDAERVKLAAAALMLAPYIPMLFMGEEYADDTPFFYFVDHSDPGLIKLVQEGRKNEFKDYGFDQSPPDPQSDDTFQRSKIHWEKRKQDKYRKLLCWHKRLIGLRKESEVLKNFNKEDIEVQVLGQKGFVLTRKNAFKTETLIAVFNFSDVAIPYTFNIQNVQAKKILDSRDPEFTESTSAYPEVMPQQISSAQELELPPYSVTIYKI
ncbi:MAG TPA: malto-oligosyltrehalose trehalohydrolase, partial [Flavisolibacter sp.]|nr:malto-oligosyltrehalose trehalohydrolase [Flavisolibacter sp.]